MDPDLPLQSTEKIGQGDDSQPRKYGLLSWAYYALRAVMPVTHKQQSKYRVNPHLGRRLNRFSMCILPGYLPRLYVSEEYVMYACFYTVYHFLFAAMGTTILSYCREPYRRARIPT